MDLAKYKKAMNSHSSLSRKTRVHAFIFGHKQKLKEVCRKLFSKANN